MESPLEIDASSRATCHLVIWHTEGTAISGLLSWMWRLKKSLPAAGIELTLASLELQPFQFAQVCPPEEIYDVRIRKPQEFVAFLKEHRTAVHLINHSYEYVDLIGKLSSTLLQRLTLVGICHTDQDYYYHNLRRLDSHLAGIIAVSPRCAERLEQMLPHRLGAIPVLPDWDMPLAADPPFRPANEAHPLRVLFNGRILHVQKRVLDLPAISRRLAQAGTPVEITIAGDGPDLPKLRDEFARGPHVPHRLLLSMAPWDMTQLLNEHDVFLQISEFEGASVSLMEAMISGLVPVVTKIASGIDLLQHNRNAILCPIGNVGAIADALTDLAGNRARLSQLGRAAFETARDHLKDLDYVHGLKKYLLSFPACSARTV